jgi:hypothetical protein
MSLKSLLKKNKHQVFRRAYYKLRQSDGEYESTWTQIDPDLIIKWGATTWSVDEIIPSFYRQSGLSLKVLNVDGKFAGTEEEQSVFNGALTTYRTLVRIDAGYIDTDATEYPTNATQYIGFISEDLTYTEDGTVQIKTKHISSIFDEFPASEVSGLGTTQTASEIVTRIQNHTDGSSNLIFQKYISSTAWNITATTNNYNINTSTGLENLTVAKLLNKLAVAENFIWYIDGDGQFYFKGKDAISTTSDYHLSGLGDDDKTWGHNLLDQISVNTNLRKVYNRVDIKLARGDTTTAFYRKKESWTWGDSSSSFRFGIRKFDYFNEFLSTATAVTIANTIFSDFSEPKQEVDIKAKFLPQLTVQKRVSLTYRTQRPVVEGASLWGYFLWGYGKFGERPGYNIDINNTDYRIIQIKHNYDNFTSDIKLRGL